MSASSRRTFLAGGAVAGVGALAACSGSASDDDGAAAAVDGPPVQGGELAFAEIDPPTTFQVHTSSGWPANNVVNNVVDRLVHLDPDTYEIVPWLATEWVVSEDQREIEFTLREGVTFSDGTTFDAQIVKENFDLWGSGAPDRDIPGSPDYEGYASSEVLAPDRIRIVLSEPDSNFITLLTWGQSGFVARSTLELSNEEQSRAENLVGTGPFTIASYTADQELVLEARPDYAWGPADLQNTGRPHLDRVRIVFVNEISSRAGALRSGQVQLVRGVQKVDAESLAGAGFQILPFTLNTGLTYAINFRPENSLLTDVRVREALSRSIDRDVVVSALLGESYRPSLSILARRAYGSQDFSDLFAFDQDAAQSLLDDAGWTRTGDGIREKNGTPLELVIAATAQDQSAKQVFELITQQWAEIGVRLNATVGDRAFSAKAKTDPAVPLYTTYVQDFDAIATYYDSRTVNVLLHSVPEFDATVDEYRATPLTDPDTSTALVGELQRILLENHYVAPIHDAVQLHAAAPQVRGVVCDSRARLHLADAWIAG